MEKPRIVACSVHQHQNGIYNTTSKELFRLRGLQNVFHNQFDGFEWRSSVTYVLVDQEQHGIGFDIFGEFETTEEFESNGAELSPANFPRELEVVLE